jgi:predicted DsbA family dithiol-disulfide isomerase
LSVVCPAMIAKVTYYLDVISSWCHWAEPSWAELKRRYSERVEFEWQIALLGPEGLPTSRDQEDWFYRRSGLITGSPYMLRSDWLEPGLKEYLAPNCVALAARNLGVADDRVRLALAQAALREGRRVGSWEESVATAAAVSGIDHASLLSRAKAPEIEEQARKTTSDFHALQVTQRPAFVLDSGIGDRAVFSGFWRLEPLVAALDSMLTDAGAYASWKAHFGDAPTR